MRRHSWDSCGCKSLAVEGCTGNHGIDRMAGNGNSGCIFGNAPLAQPKFSVSSIQNLTQSHGAEEAQTRVGHISEVARGAVRMRDGFEIIFLSKNKKSDKGQN